MATLSKTQGVSVLSHQAITHPNTVVGSALDWSTKLGSIILLFHSSVEATANTNPGKFLVQVSGSSSGNEDWVTYAEFECSATTADTEAMTATEPVSETVLAVASTSGFAVNDYLYIQDTGTLADSEWGRCQKIVTNTSIQLIDGLTNQKDSADVIWNDADLFTCVVGQEAARVRVVFQHEGATGANCHIKALAITVDSIS